MIPYEIIRKKRDKNELSAQEIREFVSAYVTGSIPDYQMSAFLMTVYLQGLTSQETVALTEAYIASGAKLDFSDIGIPTSDKHSTGGIGDKVSLPLAALVSACGVGVPMISGRGLGHTGGTLDKLESIPGFRTNMSQQECKQILRDVGFFITAQSKEMVPADKKIYALRDVTATIESIPLIVASIMSKKLAEGTKTLVLDVKFGNGAFMKTIRDAKILAKAMVDVGNMHGVPTVALLTDMNQPMGEYAGNSLEIRETIEYLKCESRPQDLHDITMALGAIMLVLSKCAENLLDGKQKLQRALESGAGLEKFAKFIKAQGGNPEIVNDICILPSATDATELLAPFDGWLAGFDTHGIGMLAVEMGAGRKKLDDIIDPRVGFRFLAKRGDRVGKGQPIAIIFADGKEQADWALKKLGKLIRFSEEPVRKTKLLHTLIGKEISPFSWKAKIVNHAK